MGSKMSMKGGFFSSGTKTTQNAAKGVACVCRVLCRKVCSILQLYIRKKGLLRLKCVVVYLPFLKELAAQILFFKTTLIAKFIDLEKSGLFSVVRPTSEEEVTLMSE